MFFKDYKLKPFILKTLSDLKIKETTKIQEESLPLTLNKKSLIITSQTGSGKTLCYLIPSLNNLNLEEIKTQVIVILPTKELARQIYSKYLDFLKNETNLKVTLLIGNSDLEQQKRSIKNKPPHVIIGTTIRILEFLKEKIINRNIKTLVLDEVDMLMDNGFSRDINEILSYLQNDSLQKIACSATTHESIANQFGKYFKDTKVISTSKSIWTNQNVSNNIVYTSDNSNPIKTLIILVKLINPYFCIIFCNTKKDTKEIYDNLIKNFSDKKIGILHKDLSTRQRKRVFTDINNNQYQYLVATDLASRGIDIVGADVVISYGLPEDDQWYMHRIGRVGRYKNVGSSFVIYKQDSDAMINRLTKKKINFHFYLLKNDKMIDKPLKLRIIKKRMFDKQTNDKIKTIYNLSKNKVKPGYKKKMKKKIEKIKQKVKHEYIEKKIKQSLLRKNIEENKKLLKKKK